MSRMNERASRLATATMARFAFLFAWCALVTWLMGTIKVYYIFGWIAAVVLSLLARRRPRAALLVPILYIFARGAIFTIHPGWGTANASLLIPSLLAVPLIVYLTPARELGRFGRIVLKLCVAVLSLNLTFFAAEQIMKQITPRDPYQLAPMEGSPGAGLYKPDLLLLRRQRPNFRGRFIHPEYHGEIYQTNADGYRGAPWPNPMPDGETRILFLGDSLTAGLGLEDDETIPAVTEKILQKNSSGAAARALNTGVSSYGPRQYEFLLKELYPRTTPSIVCIMFYDGNDVDDCRVQFLVSRDNGVNQKLLPSERQAADVVTNTDADSYISALRPPNLWERRHWVNVSVVCRLLDARLGPVFVKLGLAGPMAVYNYPLLAEMRRDPSAVTRENYELATEAIRNIHAFCKEKGIQPIFVRLPAKIQTEPAQFEAVLADHSLKAGDYDRTMPGARMLALCESLQMPSIDFLKVFETRERTGNSFFYDEGHPNREGARRIAQMIAEFILSNNLIPASRPK